MTSQSLIYIAVALVLVVWIGVRQLTWQNVTQRSVWLMPAIVSAAGVVELVASGGPGSLTPGGIALFCAELAVSLGLGALMGRLARFRRMPEGTVDGRGRPLLWQTRTGWIGLVLWCALIGLRIGADAWADAQGLGALVASTGGILLVVGANRLCRSAVLSLRMQRHHLAVPA